MSLSAGGTTSEPCHVKISTIRRSSDDVKLRGSIHSRNGFFLIVRKAGNK